MRLHRLTITAFGPFGGTQHIDFDDLSAAGLFLLHGPTGAGKTSVLDAVCYALYNEVPGARRGSDLALRSDHADPGTATEVVLEFTVAGRRLEVTRRPEQLRPKKRGSGLTKEKAFSALREKPAGAAEWKGLSRSHQEIGEEIKQLLGMSREQFCQVVLLPQGDFARFLRAEDAARGKLLRSLFGTGRFLAVEERLADQRRSAEARVRTGDEHLLALAHRMQQAAADPTLPQVATPSPSTAVRDGSRRAPGPSGAGLLGGEPPTGGPGGEAPGRGTGRSPEAGVRGRSPQETVKGRDRGPSPSARRATVPAQGRRPAEPPVLAAGEPGLAEAVLEWAALARSNAREALAVADVAVRAAEDAHRDARQHAESAARLAANRLRHAEAVRRGEALAARRDAHEEARARLERAAAAESVAPALELRAKATAAHRAAVTAEEQAREALPAAHRADGADELAAAERTLREELGALSAARRAEERAAGIVAETAALEAEARADEEALAEADQWLAVWETTRERHRQRIETARDAVGLAERLAGALEPARRRLEAARRRDALARQVEEAEAGLPAVRTEALDARAHWLDLKERRLDGMAAELAAGLQPGRACAVCGATEHPAPARPGAGHVDRAAEEAALAAHQHAEARREAAEGRLRSLHQELAAATAEAGDESTAGLAGALAELTDRHAAATRASHDLLPTREALAAAEREYERRREDRQQAGLRLASRTSRRENLERERQSLQHELDRARGGEASVAHRAALLEDRLAALAAAAEAAREAARTAAALAAAEADLAGAAARAGFADPDEAAAALMDADGRRELSRRLEQWRAAELAVAAELADPELLAAAAAPPADPEAARAEAETAHEALQRAFARAAAARTRCEELDRLSAEAAADVRRLAPLREEYHRVAELAALAAGTSARNELKMRLESYVLAARLEQVAAAATARLQRMSAGRYTLVHSDARTGGRGRSGLGLHVVDAWTGSERDTATLSGGETFFVSLSLALGLADVVTEEAGGTRLETLFIDEGFGSLDEQTLDEVLDVLDSLRTRDRAVGIVSHVADLRRRIPAQLQVVKERSGSAVRHRTARCAG